VSELGTEQLTPTFFLRRARVELSGEFLQRWQWTVAGDWGRTAAALKAQPTDVFINYQVAPELNFELGQIKIPFTAENRTSENITPFLENAMAVRNLGAPLTRDIGAMVWGEAGRSLVHYEVGIFNGDGPNRLNVDRNADVVVRAFLHPFRDAKETALERLQIGGSARYGLRSAKTVGYDVNPFTTQGGYAFWKPNYTDSAGNLVHIIPSHAQTAIAGEFYWPVGPVDLTGELVWVNEGTREARDGFQLAPAYTDRYGARKGYSYYGQLGLWVSGDRQYVRKPGYGDPAHIDFKKPLQPSRDSIEALVRIEQFRVTYAGASRAGDADTKTPDGNIRVDAITFGLNYWATRRVRLAINYGLYVFPGSEPVSASANGSPQQDASQRALAPAQQLPKGADDVARDSGHVLHELALRLAVGF
jgi:phosphate-selective porin